jgi:hypothetical protein
MKTRSVQNLTKENTVKDLLNDLKGPASRRSFMKKGLVAAGTATMGAGLLAKGVSLFGQDQNEGGNLNNGDIAILRFLAAAELIESDLWQQYAELGGIGDNPPIEVDPNQTLNNYQIALSNLDSDGPQYITSNWTDEVSHAAFLNGYLESKGADPVDLDEFRTLPSSKATGAQDIGRLTNLMSLNVDTSWYIRYRSATNPDFGATFPQAITLNGVTAIPRNNDDFNGVPFNGLPGNAHVQAIANVAAFHFGYIEQGGSSLYATLSQKVSSLEVFPNFFSQYPNPLNQPSLIFPIPCEFISPDLPNCAVIRPSDDKFAGAVATIASFTADGLFAGQQPKFFQTVNQLAEEADAATREL